VEITLPADAELVSAIRLTASGMAASARCTLDEIDDVKLAVSEVLLALLEHGRGDTVTVALHLDDSQFSIQGRAPADGFDQDDPDLAVCRTILAELCASHSIDFADDQLKIDAAVPVLAAAPNEKGGGDGD
jgi:anti-sigma regulatory factor (Ser/Thr protein kinase)